jgi:hypothetical protein
VRWQSVAVAAGLAAPPLLLAAAVWPDPGGEGTGSSAGVEGELGPGDDDRAGTDGLSSTDFLVTGPGVLRIDVDGPTFDPTLTLVDPDTGEQLDYNDDSDDLNPSLTVELDEGETVRAQVRSLGGPPGGSFTIRVVEVGAVETATTVAVPATTEP